MGGQLTLIIEKGSDGHLWGRIKDKGDFMPTGQGGTVKELIKNVKDSITDYQEHEGKTDRYWKKVNVDEMELELVYDIQAFFEAHDYLNISAVATRAGINQSLLRQYTSGKKYPSAEQVKKIEDAIQAIGRELEGTALVA